MIDDQRHAAELVEFVVGGEESMDVIGRARRGGVRAPGADSADGEQADEENDVFREPSQLPDSTRVKNLRAASPAPVSRLHMAVTTMPLSGKIQQQALTPGKPPVWP